MAKSKITKHAKLRYKQRTNLSSLGAKQNASQAFSSGYTIRAFKGAFYAYLRHKQLSGNHYTVRVFNDFIYVFDNLCHPKRLVTVYPVPERYVPTSNYLLDSFSNSPCFIYIVDTSGHISYVCESSRTCSDIAFATEFRTKQRANNYIRNDNYLMSLKKQGCRIVVCPL